MFIPPPDHRLCQGHAVFGRVPRTGDSLSRHKDEELSYSCCVVPHRRRRQWPMGEGVCAIPDLRAVGSALLLPRPRAVGSLGRAGHTAHSTVVYGCAIAHTAEAMPQRLPGHAKLTHASGHKGMPGCAAVRGPVSAAAETAPPLDCSRAPLGSQALFRPPVGSATRSNSYCAWPYLIAPQGTLKEGTGAAALCPCRWCCSPPN